MDIVNLLMAILSLGKLSEVWCLNITSFDMVLGLKR